MGKSKGLKRRMMSVGKSKKKKNSEAGPGDQVQAYTGRINVPRAPDQMDRILRNVTTMTSQSSTAGGAWLPVFQTDCSAIAQFTAEAAEFDEWRCLAIEIRFLPVSRYNLLPGVGVVVADMNTVTALASLQAASEYASAKPFCATDPFEFNWHAEGRNLMTWQPVGSGPTYFGAIKIYSSNHPASTVIGYVFCRWLVQFRGTI